MKSPFFIALCVLSLTNAGLLPYGSAAPSPIERPFTAIDLSGGANDSDTSGELDLLVPVTTVGNTLLFFNPRTSADSADRQFGSVGIGGRHLFAEGIAGQPLILGFSGYYDFMNSSHGNDFSQFGASFEILSDRFDFRLNGYLPESSQKEIDSRRIRTSNTDTRVDRQSFSYYGDPYGASHQVRQDQFFGVNETTTTVTTTIDQLFRNSEAAMKGFDTEFGLRLFRDVRLYAGYESYQNPFGGEDLSGAKGRIEARVLPGLTFEAGYYEENRLRGSDWSANLRFNIPLGKGGMRQAFSRSFNRHQPRAFSERLTERVARSSIKTTESGYREDVSARRIQRELDQETRRLVTGRTTHIIRDQIIWADDVNGNDITGDGTFENPVQSFADATDKAIAEFNLDPPAGAWTVYLIDQGTTYDGFSKVFNGADLNVTSSGEHIQALGGKVFTTGTGQNATVTGDPVLFVEGGNLSVRNINFEDITTNMTALGSLSIYNFSGSVELYLNEFNDPNNTSNRLLSIDQSTDADYLIANNIFTKGAANDGIYLTLFNDAQVSATVLDNQFTSGSDFFSGVVNHIHDNAHLDILYSGNTFSSHFEANAIHFITEESGAVDANVISNLFDGEITTGIAAGMFSDAPSFLSIEENIFGEDILVQNIALYYDNTLADFAQDFYIAHNEFYAAGTSDGIEIDVLDSARANGIITYNHFSILGEADGIDGSASDDGYLDVSISHNTFIGDSTLGNGIDLRSEGAGSVRASISFNDFHDLRQSVYWLIGNDAPPQALDVSVSHNTFSGTSNSDFRAAFWIYSSSTGAASVDNVTFSNNEFHNGSEGFSADYGMVLTSGIADNMFFDVDNTFEQIIIQSNRWEGAQFEAADQAAIDLNFLDQTRVENITITANQFLDSNVDDTITTKIFDAIQIHFGELSSTVDGVFGAEIDIRGNQFISPVDGYIENAVAIQFRDQAIHEGITSIESNTFENVFRGISLSFRDEAEIKNVLMVTNEVHVFNNVITLRPDVGLHGIEVEFRNQAQNATSSAVTIEENEINGGINAISIKSLNESDANFILHKNTINDAKTGLYIYAAQPNNAGSNLDVLMTQNRILEFLDYGIDLHNSSDGNINLQILPDVFDNVISGVQGGGSKSAIRINQSENTGTLLVNINDASLAWSEIGLEIVLDSNNGTFDLALHETNITGLGGNATTAVSIEGDASSSLNILPASNNNTTQAVGNPFALSGGIQPGDISGSMQIDMVAYP